MKAPSSSEEEEDDGAKENQKEEDIVFDYSDFFSVLMYYGHMSTDEIMNHSRAFLHGIYRVHHSRIKENLSIAYFSSGKEEAESNDSVDESVGQYELSASDYPTEFTKLPPKHMIESTPEATREFLSGFGDAMAVFKDVQIEG